MNRRDFLQAAAGSFTLASAVGAVSARADEKQDAAGPPVNTAVIGIGDQGRNILTSLAKLGPTAAPILHVCDSFDAPVIFKRAAEFAPTAEKQTDYRKVLDDKKVQAVFVATPSHLHKQIVLDALQAGKHVYCEAPLASDLADAKAMATAGLAAKTLLFPGLQLRSNSQAVHVGHFIKALDFGRITQGRGHWHHRDTWRRAHPDGAREKALNWRLSKETSTGLIGEIGIHQIDLTSMYLGVLPISVSGYSTLNLNLPGSDQGGKDDRDVPTIAQVIVEYPGGVTYYFDASLLSSFENVRDQKGKDEGYSVYYATGGTFLLRDQRAWMYKEADARTLGWEGYARKDVLKAGEPANGTGEAIGIGIALVADASKQIALGKEPGKVGTDVSKTSLYQSVDAFVKAVSKNTKPSVGPLEGYQATVLAHKCNEAAIGKTRIELDPALFTL